MALPFGDQISFWCDEEGEFHREDGPAFVGPGYQAYYLHGLRHRIGGPAEIYDDGSEYYFEYGIPVRSYDEVITKKVKKIKSR